ncbi:MAG: hydantoinase/oxoprolinase family protein [Pseudomonadota bacterium]
MRYLAADVGGTFTDLVLVDGAAAAARVFIDKVPSQATGSGLGVREGIKRLAAAAGIVPAEIDLFVHGFTVGTNAFLTRSGAKAALVVTRGFRDLLLIGNQMRPSLYSLTAKKPPPVVPRSRTVEALERIDAFGQVVTALSPAEAHRVARAVAALEPEAVAICLTFAHLNPSHEAMLAEAIGQVLPGVPLYLSSRVNPQIEEYPRANTTAVAAYAGPVIDRYIGRLEANLAEVGLDAPLRLMRSDGGVATPRAARENPAHMLLSGPAGGVIAGAELARALGIAGMVTFDMGGTSADFSVILEGRPSMVAEREIDGQPLRLPTIDIETISAGGGSIARVDIGGALRVGPRSAGAVPGPACYGQGGTDATVTDAAVVMGLLDPDEYLGGEMRLDPDLAARAVERHVAKPLGLGLEEAAYGIVSVANANMIQAIRALSVERGHDVRGFALLAFGGAGPLYAPYMARELAMAEVVAPRNPGVFAAQGLLLTDIRHAAQAPFQRNIAKLGADEIGARLLSLEAELARALEADGVPPEERYFRFAADMRCVGQFHLLTIPLAEPTRAGAPANETSWWDAGKLAADFHAAHERAYGHAEPSVPVEIVNLRVDGFGKIRRPPLPPEPAFVSGLAEPVGKRRVYFDRSSGWIEAAVHRRDRLEPGQEIAGPAIVMQRDSTVVLLPGQRARVDARGTIRIAIKAE